MLSGTFGPRNIGMDSNADFFSRERLASVESYLRARREPGSIPNGFRKSTRRQTERCNGVCRNRFRRRYCARRVLGLPVQIWTFSPGG